MVDWAKKIEKLEDNGFATGEEIIAAAFTQPLGAIKQAAIAGGIGGLPGIFMARKMKEGVAKQSDMTRNGRAKDFPDARQRNL